MDRKQFYEALSKEDVRNAIFELPGAQQFPVKWQVGRLGLTDDKLWDLRRKKVLDFACGNGQLVDFLVNEGIDAEGIDPLAPERDNFMVQKVDALYPSKGSIPKENEFYDVALNNSNNVFCLAFSSHVKVSRRMAENNWKGKRKYLKNFDENVRKMEVGGRVMMLEILRVLKKGGRFICSPYLDKLQDKMNSELKGYRVVKEVDESILVLERMMSRNPEVVGLFQAMGHNTSEEVVPDYLKHRLVIYKT